MDHGGVDHLAGAVDDNGVLLGALPQPHPRVDRGRDHQFDAPRQPHRGRQPRRSGCRRGEVDPEALGDHGLVGVVVAAVQVDGEHLFLLAAHDRQDSVRRHLLQRFGELEVVAKLLPRRTFRDFF
jgi:hypothetical protein